MRRNQLAIDHDLPLCANISLHQHPNDHTVIALCIATLWLSGKADAMADEAMAVTVACMPIAYIVQVMYGMLCPTCCWTHPAVCSSTKPFASLCCICGPGQLNCSHCVASAALPGATIALSGCSYEVHQCHTIHAPGYNLLQLVVDWHHCTKYSILH